MSDQCEADGHRDLCWLANRLVAQPQPEPDIDRRWPSCANHKCTFAASRRKRHSKCIVSVATASFSRKDALYALQGLALYYS